MGKIKETSTACCACFCAEYSFVGAMSEGVCCAVAGKVCCCTGSLGCDCGSCCVCEAAHCHRQQQQGCCEHSPRVALLLRRGPVSTRQRHWSWMLWCGALPNFRRCSPSPGLRLRPSQSRITKTNFSIKVGLQRLPFPSKRNCPETL